MDNPDDKPLDGGLRCEESSKFSDVTSGSYTAWKHGFSESGTQNTAENHSRNVLGGFAQRTSSSPVVPDQGFTVPRGASG
jgi:hypothetical protein